MEASEGQLASIREIAESCHVSPATVSRVLNQDPGLSVTVDVRRRVEDEAARLGYRTPRQKRGDKVVNLAVALSPFEKPGFEERLVAHLATLAGPSVGIRLYERNQPSDGIIAIGDFSQDEVLDFEEHCRDILMINNLGISYSHDSIMMDYAESEERVIRLFIERGIKSAAYLGGLYERAGHLIGSHRAAQFNALLKSHGLCDKEYVSGGMDSLSGYKAVMALDEVPQALIFGDSDFAHGAFKALDERGACPLTVTYVNFFPEDVGRGMALHIFPDDIWRTAIKLVLEKVRGERTQSYSIHSPSALIETNSLKRD